MHSCPLMSHWGRDLSFTRDDMFCLATIVRTRCIVVDVAQCGWQPKQRMAGLAAVRTQYCSRAAHGVGKLCLRNCQPHHRTCMDAYRLPAAQLAGVHASAAAHGLILHPTAAAPAPEHPITSDHVNVLSWGPSASVVVYLVCVLPPPPRPSCVPPPTWPPRT